MKLVHSISEAKEICSNDVKCFAIYDDGGANERFLLCEIGAKIEVSDSGSLLYLKGTLFPVIFQLWRPLHNKFGSNFR